MINSISLSGHWIGFFTYGPDYGEGMAGKKVHFRLFIEDLNDGQFQGKCVDTEGIGASFDTSIVKGFLDHTFISFTKEYPTNYLVDEKGNKILDTRNPPPRLSYSGQYNNKAKSFIGKWEIWANERPYGEGSLVNILTGNWEMYKDK